MQTRPRRTVKVAVVGSGLAGLTTSYLLATLGTRRDVEYTGGDDVEFEVHIFEQVCLYDSPSIRPGESTACATTHPGASR